MVVRRDAVMVVLTLGVAGCSYAKPRPFLSAPDGATLPRDPVLHLFDPDGHQRSEGSCGVVGEDGQGKPLEVESEPVSAPGDFQARRIRIRSGTVPEVILRLHCGNRTEKILRYQVHPDWRHDTSATRITHVLTRDPALVPFTVRLVHVAPAARAYAISWAHTQDDAPWAYAVLPAGAEPGYGWTRPDLLPVEADPAATSAIIALGRPGVTLKTFDWSKGPIRAVVAPLFEDGTMGPPSDPVVIRPPLPMVPKALYSLAALMLAVWAFLCAPKVRAWRRGVAGPTIAGLTIALWLVGMVRYEWFAVSIPAGLIAFVVLGLSVRDLIDSRGAAGRAWLALGLLAALAGATDFVGLALAAVWSP